MTTTIKRIGAVAVGMCVLLVVAWYLALYHPEQGKLRSANAAHAAAEQQISQLDSQEASLRALLRDVPADTKALAALESNVPKGPSLDGVLIQLHQDATASGVQLGQVGPSSPLASSSGGSSSSSPQGSGTQAITISMSATGSYPQMVNFVKGLARMQRTLVVDHLGIAGSGHSLTAQITARIFFTGAA